ncbi:uridine kinase [Candidatus Sumerlaeota bacterium]|nr:uridine kinase [Candidatus Sumerlaeota bacterium]
MRNLKGMLIGIAGGTGSGKTTVAKAIRREIPEEDVIIISQDMYYRNNAHLPLEEREKINYDHPDAFDNKLLFKHLSDLKKGKEIQRPVYCFTTHLRLSEKVLIKPAHVIILEGIMVLVNPAIRNLLDIKIFVDTDADVRFIRRLSRDIKERGRSVQSIIDQYLHVVRLMHMEFIEPSKRFADVIVPEGGFNMVAVDLIVTKIRSILDEKQKTNAGS